VRSDVAERGSVGLLTRLLLAVWAAAAAAAWAAARWGVL
jgi:hypothetical protein